MITLLTYLPDYKPKRWTAYRKASVVCALIEGALSMDTVIELYDLSKQEIDLWADKYLTGGISAMRDTHRMVA